MRWNGLVAVSDATLRRRGLRYIDDCVMHRADVNNNGTYTDTGDGSWFHVTDAMFSTVAVVNAGGTIVERVSYDSYGKARHHRQYDVDGDGDTDSNDHTIVDAIEGAGDRITQSDYRAEADLDRNGRVTSTDKTLANTSQAAIAAGLISRDADNAIGWDGYVFNAATGDYLVRHRTYMPTLGRWAERDPIGHRDGANLYQYANGRTNDYADPSGLVTQTPEPMAGGGGCCKAMSLKFVDWGKYRNGFNDDALNLNPDAIAVENIDVLVEEAAKRVDECAARGGQCCCISDLKIFGHGAIGDISIGGGTAAVRKPDDSVTYPQGKIDKNQSLEIGTLQRIEGLKRLMCSDGKIELHSCRTGSGDEGSLFLKGLANATGVPCSAPIFEVYAAKDGSESAASGATIAPRKTIAPDDAQRRPTCCGR